MKVYKGTSPKDGDNYYVIIESDTFSDHLSGYVDFLKTIDSSFIEINISEIERNVNVNIVKDDSELTTVNINIDDYLVV